MSAQILAICQSDHAELPAREVNKLQEQGLAVGRSTAQSTRVARESLGHWQLQAKAAQVQTKQMGQAEEGPAACAGRGAYRIIGHHSLVLVQGIECAPPATTE